MKTIYIMFAFAFCLCFAGAIHGSGTIIPLPIVAENETVTFCHGIVTGMCTFGDCPVAMPTVADKSADNVADKTAQNEEIAILNDCDDEKNAHHETATETDAYYSASYFCRMGVIYWNGWRWTWYSERVLPGYGLRIPGRYTDYNGYVRDENGYICIASDDLDYGTVVSTPFGGYGKVYDCGAGYGTLDVYVGW